MEKAEAEWFLRKYFWLVARIVFSYYIWSGTLNLSRYFDILTESGGSFCVVSSNVLCRFFGLHLHILMKL